jgi:hypothetical protein
MAKDAAIFNKGKVKGEVRYPPWDDDSRLRRSSHYEDMRREMARFAVFPLGRIREFPRHIPYSSDKKGFLEKTGRDSFEGPFSIIPPNLLLQLIFHLFAIFSCQWAPRIFSDGVGNGNSIPVHLQNSRRGR